MLQIQHVILLVEQALLQDFLQKLLQKQIVACKNMIRVKKRPRKILKNKKSSQKTKIFIATME